MRFRKSLTIGWFYPDLMSTYGDRGNIIVLTKQCEWRGVEVVVERVTLETNIKKLQKCDLIFMGGAQDRQQKIAGDDFRFKKGPVIKNMIDKGIPALFVCAAYQAVGHYYQPYQGERIPGPGIFDLFTKHPGDQAKRLIGNVAAEIINLSFLPRIRVRGKLQQESSKSENWIPHQVRDDKRVTIVGFENHGGKTYLGPELKPFARVIRGFGNNGEDGFEGAVYKNSIGSYFHGPILPKNPHLGVWLISKALEVKYQKDIQLEPIDDKLEWQAHNFMLNRLGVK